MSLDLEQKLKNAFSIIDSSEDGLVEWIELKAYCENLHIALGESDKAEFQSLSKARDKDGIGLDFTGFSKFVKNRLRTVFRAVDKNNNGFIDQIEITELLDQMGATVCDRQVVGILQTLDKDGDMLIDFDEFCTFFAHIPSADMQYIANLWSSGEGLDIGSDMVPLSLPPVEMPLIQFMVAGGVGGIVSRTLTAPLEKVKIIAQTSSGSEIAKRTFRDIYRHEGFRGLFSGNLANCIRVFPTSAIIGLVYSRMIKYTPVDNTDNPHQPAWRFMSGVTAGVISTALTHPLDVVRARLTIQDASVKNSNTYTGIMYAFKRITAEEGVSGLYKGLRPSLLSIAPFIGLQQCTYDVLKLYALKYTSGSSSTFLVCGALAGITAQTVVYPLDLIRRQIQVERTNKPHKHFLSSLKDLWIQGGMRSIFAGITISYLKVIPAAASSLLVRDYFLGRTGNVSFGFVATTDSSRAYK